METITLLFWANVLCAITNVVFVVWRLRHRLYVFALVSGAALVITLGAVGSLWSVWGACLLPHPDVVEFRPDMTLCPGQSTTLEIIVPSPHRDL